MPAISQCHILILATDGFEQSELLVPLTELRQEGATVHVCAPANTKTPGAILGWDEGDWGDPVPVDLTLDTVTAQTYDALVLPGGVMNPDTLRTDSKAIALIKQFAEARKPIAAICHGPWLLAEAGIVKDVELTSYNSIKTDMVNAGALWEDSDVVSDQNIITSRNPDDLPAFVARIVMELEASEVPAAA